MKKLLILFCITLLAACNNGRIGDPNAAPIPEEEAIQTGPVSGDVFGSPWYFNQGKARKRNVGGAETYIVELWQETFTDACDPFNTPARSILLVIPNVTGTFTLSSNRTVTFNTANNNLIATEGLYTITEIRSEANPPTILAGVKAIFDEKNTINGSFEIIICP